MGEKIFIARQDTLEGVNAKVQHLVDNLAPLAKPVYGMIIHEASNLNPATRVEYIGYNKEFTPMQMNMSTHAMAQNSWADWSYLKKIKPCMANFDGGINYYLDPNDYTKKEDGTASDVSNVDYSGDAMVEIPLIYKKEYNEGHDRVVLFCENQIDEDFRPAGFVVNGKTRSYMLIPMFYGSVDDSGRARSLAGQRSCHTITGNTSEGAAKNWDTAEQYAALQAASTKTLFFGGGILHTLADLAMMLVKNTDSQASFGSGMCQSYVDDKSQWWGTKTNEVVGGGMFYGSNDDVSFNKIFHSCVLGSYMIWQRDPYNILVNGVLKVAPDYKYDPTGATLEDTGCRLYTNNYYACRKAIPGFGSVEMPDIIGSTSLGYCDHTWVNVGIVAVSIALGDCNVGARGGLRARGFYNLASYASWSNGASKLLYGPAIA